MKAKKITAKHPLGFIVEFELEEKDNFTDKINGLARAGYRSPTATDDWRRTPEGLPICAVHNEVMPKREKQGDEWHSHKVTDEYGEIHYCRGYAHASSKGFEIRPKTTRRPTSPQQPVGFTPPQRPAQRPAQPTPPPAPPQMPDELPPHIWDDSVVQVMQTSRTFPRKPVMSQPKPQPKKVEPKVDLVDELNMDLFGF